MDLHQYICKKFLVKVVRVVIIFFKAKSQRNDYKETIRGLQRAKTEVDWYDISMES